MLRLHGCSTGLSPRVRGNHSIHAYRKVDKGSIPACAGEPHGSNGGSCLPWVYPRVCGGTSRMRVTRFHCHGLSPRVRGNPGARRLRSGLSRSIPACAGEPSAPSGSTLSIWVYPRVCGGTPVCNDISVCPLGLSPRVRGNLSQPQIFSGCNGSIPACAGEPADSAPTRRL